eukprot:NODE_5617_length_656_cov_26.270181_g5235_i0.p1 GENE.NODE_5617_length_656_cov_26.270181_g5235_i0~~NODE_5617_length_656_cov_26.270181_g5235_i0.p1  ORF type:complete len:194 (-),score=51.67 NODE_5617_length_656_cov_26.270181_g5235_i0:74-601(-)
MWKAAMMLMPILIIREVDFKDETNYKTLVIFFLSIQVSLICTLCFLFLKIHKKADQKTIKVETPPPYGSNDPPSVEHVTVQGYDKKALRAVATKLVIALSVCAFLHFKWSLIPPLVMQCFINPSTVFGSQLFKIHALGQAEKGPLERPWKEVKPFENLLGAGKEQEKKKKEKKKQ